MTVEEMLDDLLERAVRALSAMANTPMNAFSRVVAAEIMIASTGEALQCRARADYDTMNRILDWQARYISAGLQQLLSCEEERAECARFIRAMGAEQPKPQPSPENPLTPDELRDLGIDEP